MFVCICNAITDHQIKESIAAGASSLTDLKDQLGVATCCGCCSDLASSYIAAASGNQVGSISASIAVEH